MTPMVVLHTFSIKSIFYDKMDLRHFPFQVMICSHKKPCKNNAHTLWMNNTNPKDKIPIRKVEFLWSERSGPFCNLLLY